MAVYVDNARIPATVARIRSRWSHLTADTEPELHTFAQHIGLQRSWYQTCKRPCAPQGQPCPHWHYDVTDTKRTEAIAAGAQPIDIRKWVEIAKARRAAARATA
ncbi:DUF4031 domain-containing protein [Micromonospora endolithica]|uniref:DUF4031 domain-containing protein n=1 Tax=Micromonospora endolithica TaxID=230091 RepID=A0A3A9YT46_9ACTN|nr:DUF4031 domain-containing protein [Micromonospora endolithica]RKN38467.1 DUF4031 domain-containing protein [Micromonospora endolithica]TWJ23110.1 uncharacterized protein DUF4031 [Micromonospora endolithica]